METASFLVTGGCGLTGSHIVEKLLQRYPRATVAVMSRCPTENRFPGVSYHAGDVGSREDVTRVFGQVRPTVVFHVAGVTTAVRKPIPDETVRRINQTGTQLMLDACRAQSSDPNQPDVKAFVFTSSASVVQRENGGFMAIHGGDETLPTVREEDKAMIYPTTKAAAERLVLAADGDKGMRTVSLRPAVIYGERDNDITPTLLAALAAGRHTKRIGGRDNKRMLLSSTYAGNAADAHLLAAEKLLSSNPGGVAGEAFFVTNGFDTSLWEFSRVVWRCAGTEVDPAKVTVINPTFALWFAWAVEWLCWLRGTRPMMTQQVIRFSQLERYFDISKARERLGYEPAVQWEEGVRRAVKWALDEEKRKAADGEQK